MAKDYPQLAGKIVLTLAGRITRLKGHEAFITLIEELINDKPSIHGLIVGGAEAKKIAYLNELKQLIHAKGLEEHISLIGHRSDMREVFSQSDIVYSLSSQAETFGRTTLEALSIGTPVIGWNHGGVGGCAPQRASDRDCARGVHRHGGARVRAPVRRAHARDRVTPPGAAPLRTASVRYPAPSGRWSIDPQAPPQTRRR